MVNKPKIFISRQCQGMEGPLNRNVAHLRQSVFWSNTSPISQSTKGYLPPIIQREKQYINWRPEKSAMHNEMGGQGYGPSGFINKKDIGIQNVQPLKTSMDYTLFIQSSINGKIYIMGQMFKQGQELATVRFWLSRFGLIQAKPLKPKPINGSQTVGF